MPATNLSKYYPAHELFFSNEISYLYDHSTSYTTDSVDFLGSKPHIGISMSTYDLGLCRPF